MPIKVNGTTSGSVTLAAPATGSDVTLTLPNGTGTNGQLLSTNGSGVLSFVNGGKILQVVRATDGTDRTTTSTSFVDASLSVTITPQRSDSAIILIHTTRVDPQTNANCFTQITDNSNNAISGAAALSTGGTTTGSLSAALVQIGYATPATTSAVTYKVRFRTTSGTSFLVNSAPTAQLYAIEVAA